jgi:uncharacterized repeat protein (TIGR01451 family)
MKKLAISFVGFLLLVTATAAFGQVKVDLKQFKVVDTNGKQELLAVEKTKPGDVVEYVATYHNVGKAAVKNVVGTVPVPNGMEYVPDQNTKAPDMAAAADGKFAPVPLKHKVMRNGVQVEEVLPYSAYRSLQWKLGTMMPDQKIELKARVKLAPLVK